MGKDCWTHIDNGKPESGSWVFCLEEQDSYLSVPDVDDIFIGQYRGDRNLVTLYEDAPPVAFALWHYIPKLKR